MKTTSANLHCNKNYKCKIYFVEKYKCKIYFVVLVWLAIALSTASVVQQFCFWYSDICWMHH